MFPQNDDSKHFKNEHNQNGSKFINIGNNGHQIDPMNVYRSCNFLINPEVHINDIITIPHENITGQKSDLLEMKMKQNEKETNKQLDAPIWDELCAMMLIGYSSLLEANIIFITIQGVLDEMVKMNYVDWSIINPFVIEGRCYTIHDTAEFRCEVYTLQSHNDDKKSVVAISRIFGDGWIFKEFRTMMLNQLFKKNYIISENENENDFENIKYNDDIMTTNDFPYHNNDTDETNDIFTVDAITKLLFDAIDCSQCRDILHENLQLLRLAINDENKIKIILKTENLFDHLLRPIRGKNQLLDTWIIKTILETVEKLIEYESNTILSTQHNAYINFVLPIVKDIKKQWTTVFEHPLGLCTFYPSQQIVRICNCLLQKWE